MAGEAGRTGVTFEAIKQRVRAIPELAAWPQMLQLTEKVVHRESLSVWDYPGAACLAVGGEAASALPGAAAVFCSLISIHLVDDMLDHDPKGDYHRIGAGPAANLGLAFQAAGHLLLDDPGIHPRVRAELHAAFARMSIGTAFGQDMDSKELRSEEEYWLTVETKTPPLFGAAFRMGALLGGAPEETASQLEAFGETLGRFVQVSDDLSDALETPARADWGRRSNNLPILYAMTAEHPERERFLELSARPDDSDALAEAQKILLRSGAVSYCVFKMVEISDEARRALAGIPLRDTEPVERILSAHLRPLHKMLESVGMEEPATLELALE
ncbi:MAG TPA: polyprenyl synthetase family protein [Thermoanaerobaculia bacterium]|nr:polyprenyl synthetase family protein [Thermoanaerobaculia bacterium]